MMNQRVIGENISKYIFSVFYLNQTIVSLDDRFRQYKRFIENFGFIFDIAAIRYVRDQHLEVKCMNLQRLLTDKKGQRWDETCRRTYDFQPCCNRMDRWKGCVALVTGASTGIGAEICRVLVKYGITVVGVARNVGKIRAIAREEAVENAPGHLFGIKCDLANEEEILAVFEKIRDDFGRIDICINNAGFGSNTSLMSGHTEDWRNMIDVNVMALCICTRESLKLMKEKNINSGQIIHISSMSGHRVPTSNASFYSGTKFMVRALAEGLRKELRAAKSHIRVASISPGLVETEFAYRMLDDPEKARELYSSIECLQPSDIAESVLYILSTNPRVDVNDILIRPVEQES